MRSQSRLLLNTHKELRILAAEPKLKALGELNSKVSTSRCRGQQELGPSLLQGGVPVIASQSAFESSSPCACMTLAELDRDVQDRAGGEGADAAGEVDRQ